jgi:VWFA-related protein
MNFSNHNKSLKDVMKRAEQENVMVYAIGLAGENGMPTSFARPGDGGGRGMPPGGVGGLGGRGMGGYSHTGLQLEKPDEGLPKIAAATGGGYFELTSRDNLVFTFERVADELHQQYVLGFTPATLDGKLHSLTVRVLKPQFTVRARKTYLATRVRPS